MWENVQEFGNVTFVFFLVLIAILMPLPWEIGISKNYIYPCQALEWCV